MNPKQVRLENGSESAPKIHPESLPIQDTVALKPHCGLQGRTSLEVNLPGIQNCASWQIADWASYIYKALNHHRINIALHVLPALEPSALIDLADALELAQHHKHTNEEVPDEKLSIASPCLAREFGYDPVNAFAHCCYALYNNRESLLEHLFEQLGDEGGDVLLAEALAISEAVLHYEGTLTELSAPRGIYTRLQSLAIQARESHIRHTLCVPLKSEWNSAELARLNAERGEAV